MKRLFCLLISILSVISCQLNPFVGVGMEADTIAPVLKISSHENFQYVNGKLLYLYGTCNDNQKVTSVSLRAEYDGETLFTWEIKNPVSPWSYSIQLDPLADIKKQMEDGVAGKDFRLADGQYKFTVFAYDASGYTSSDSYDSRTLVIDNEPSVTEITYPLLKTSMDFYIGEDDSRGETAGADSYNFDNSQYFRNGSFYIQGNVDDQYSPANVAITLTEYNEDKVETGKSLTVSFGSSQELDVESNIEKHLLDVDISKKPTSLWNWSIYFNENAESEDDIKTPRYYEVSVKVKDSAGNIENDKKGFFCVLPKTDYPYTIFPGYGQKIPVGTPLSGTSYDDDGIKSVKLSLCNSAGEVIDTKEDLYEQDVDGANIYTWKTDKSTPTAGGEYLLKVEVVDINGRASSYIVNESGEYLHSAEYREKMLTVVDLTAPAVEITAKKGKDESAKSVDFDVYSDVVDNNGDFQVAVKVTDASQVRKVYMARVLNTATADAVAKLSNVNPKTGNIDAWDLSANVAGIKFYNLYEYKAGDKATAEVQENWAFNIFNDFDNEFATKRFYVYAENASGKTTVSSKLLLKEEDKPEIIVSEPLQGSTLTVPFNIGVSVDDFTGIEDFTISCTQNGKAVGNELSLARFAKTLKKTGNKIDIPSFSSTEFGTDEEFESGSCMLTFTAKDKYGNVTIEKLQFYVEKDDPFIKNVIATKNVATYKPGDVVRIRVEINKEVNVTGKPTLTLNNNATATFAGKDGNYLNFDYTVKAGDDCDLLNCTALNSNGATIVDSQNLALRLDSFLKEGSGSLMTNATIRIDTVLPKISAVKTLDPNGSYSVDRVIDIQVIFSENVTINVPDGKKLRMKLNVNGKETRYAEYAPGKEGEAPNKAMFLYTVAEGDNVAELAWTGWDVDPEVEITDSADYGEDGKGNKFDFKNCDPEKDKWSNKLVIDTTPADIERIESNYTDVSLALGGGYDVDANTYYCNAGKLINLTVVFSEPVKISGEVTLALSSGSVATYSSGSGSEKLCFSYTVGVGDNTDGNLKVDGINGKIIDYAENELKEFSATDGVIKNADGKEKKLVIDTKAPDTPVIILTEKAPANNSEGISTYTALNDDGTVGVEVKTKSTIESDVYSCAWTENGSLENFSPLGSDFKDGISRIFGAREPNGFYQEYTVILELKDKAGNISGKSEKVEFIIDTGKPKLLKASPSKVVEDETDGKKKKLETSVTGTYTIGEKIDVALVFNKEMKATNLKVKLNNGKEVELSKETDNVHGNGEHYFSGVYTVEAKEDSADNLKIASVTDGSVKDLLNNELSLDTLNATLGDPSFENMDTFQEIKIDCTAPEITKITTEKTDGWYTVGEVIMINVFFSEPVEFSGDNPQLNLSLMNEETAVASYVSGSGTVEWIFNYTVEAEQNTGDSSIDYTDDSSKNEGFLKVASISGKITDLAGVSVDGNLLNGVSVDGNKLITTIPDNNLKDKEGKKDKKIGIDTIAPATLTLKAEHSEEGEVKDGDTKSGKGGTAYVTVSIAGGQEKGASFYVTKNSEVICDWQSSFDGQCKPDAGEVLDYTIAAKQRDRAGNVSQEASIKFTIDNSTPMLESISTTQLSGTCTVGTEIPITLTFNKEVKVSENITVTLNATENATDSNRIQVTVSIPTPTTETFSKTVTGTYTVKEGDVTTEVLNVSALAGKVVDKLGGSLILSNHKDSNKKDVKPLETATNLAATKQITIDTTPPELVSITTTAADGWYKAGDVIVVTLTFNEDVKIHNDKLPTKLKMSNGCFVDIQNSSGQTVTFIYNVGKNDSTGTEQNLKVDSLDMNEITDMAGNPWDKNIADSINFKDKEIGIDTAINAITIVNGEGNDPNGNSYLNNQTLTISNLTDASSDVALIECTVNGKKENLLISDGGTATITCNANDGVKTTFAVSVKMTDNAGNVSSKSVNFSIDGEEIELQSISTATDSGTYKADTDIPIVLNFNKEVQITSALTLTLTNGKKLTISQDSTFDKTKEVKYVVGSTDSGESLNEDCESLDVSTISGTVEDRRPKTLIFSSDLPTETTIADTRTINIDTQVPTVESFSSTATEDSWYNAGKMIQITMKCSEIVNVADGATLSLSSGGVATYLSGSGSNEIVFVYNVAAGNSTAGNKQLTVSQVNGTIQDIAKNDLSKSLPKELSFACGVDTKAPGSMTIDGITNDDTVTSCENLEISGFGETGGSGIASYTVNINGTETTISINDSNATIKDSVSDGKLTFSELPQNIKNDLTVGAGRKQSFAISVYQTDIAGNRSPVSNTLEFTVDTNKTRLLAVKSSKSNETCTTGAVIDISLEFSRSTSGSITITLNNGVKLTGEWSTDDLVYTATYKVEAGKDTPLLTIDGVSGSVTDALSTQQMTALWSNTDDMNLSSYKVSIDTIAPSISNFESNYNSSTGSATLTYTFNENVSIVAGKKITLTREVHVASKVLTPAAPIVLTPAQYNEYYTLKNGIGAYYEKTINGVDPSDKEKADLSAKYVLKYEYNPDNTTLVGLFKDMGYYKQEIVMESSAVTVSGNVVTVTIPKENLMTGEEYTVEAEAGIVKDVVGNANVGVLSGSLETGDVPQPPVIRVNKISGRGDTAKITTMKIHTVTHGATIKYYESSGRYYESTELKFDYSENDSVTWRGTSYKGVIMGNDNSSSGKYWITAKAVKNGEESALSYERAFKTVIRTSQGVDNTTHFMVFRGGDVRSGSNTISGFPVTWDEKSVLATWSLALADSDDVEKELAKYGMLLASNKKAITWGVPEKIYFHGLKCKKDGSKLLWMWQMENAVKVNAGEDGTDSNKLEDKYHDRDGGNY